MNIFFQYLSLKHMSIIIVLILLLFITNYVKPNILYVSVFACSKVYVFIE